MAFQFTVAPPLQNLQKLEKVQLSAARIITGLKNTCPRDIVLFEADLQLLSLRRRTCLTKYYNSEVWILKIVLQLTSKIGVITRDSGETVSSAKWLVLWNLITCHNVLTQRMILTGSSSIQNYQGEIQTVARFFRSELIAIDEALGSLAPLPNGKEIWILSDSKSAIQHLSNWQSSTISINILVLEALWLTVLQDRISLLARFRCGHIKSMKFSEGRKSFEMCTNCSSEPATPAHILECLGLTKQDLADDPLLVLDFLKVYDVMDLV
ncbi:RNase H domain-containing protein [Trichonephila clavipes]|nr:RNase H domain-containing protein [Trichonephila clavipes]